MKIRAELLYLLILLAFIPAELNSQETVGKPIARIFADYRYQLSGDTKYSGFNVTRAFLGYNYQLDENLTTQILFDIGEPVSFGGANINRYVYLRNAYISYRADKLTLTFGITNNPAAAVPKSYWGKRYIIRPFLLQYKVINVADAGLVASYKISERILLDAAIFNGEGYTRLHTTNRVQYNAGITFLPADGVAIRVNTDTYKGADSRKNTYYIFAGYRNDFLTGAIEYNYKTDFDWIDSHNISGYSALLGIMVAPGIELFGRYDRFRSVTVSGENVPWNIANDGSMYIAGVQYIHSRNISLSCNFQGWSPDDETLPFQSSMLLNVVFNY